MGRSKLLMEYITTEKARKSSFKKRTEGLVKKIRELSILCGIDACLIVYGPDGEVTWPKERKEVESILRKYEMKRNESSSKHLNLMDFFGNQTCKINEQIVKMRREIAKAKFAKSMELGLEGVSVDELNNMLNVLDKKIETVTSCIVEEKEKQKMSRGIGAVELDSSSHIVRDEYYYNALGAEHFKPLVVSSLTDTFLTQNNYQDLMADYIPMINANVVGPSSYEGPNCDTQYLQTSLSAADALKMGYPVVGSYLAAQQQQQSVLTSVLQGNGFQYADCCCQSGSCYCNFCGWQR